MPAEEEHYELATRDSRSDMQEAEAGSSPEHEAQDTIMPTTNTLEDRLNRRTLLKLDLILLPFLSLLFLLNSLDKSNIGNAESAGFTHDAGLSSHDLNLSLALFFAFFVFLQPVGAALGRKYGMARWVPACMSLWGLCTVGHIWVRKRWQLIVLRIAIASLEAGFYPTTVGYLSMFYTRYEFAVRLGVFYGQGAVAGVVGGVLSWAVFSHFPGRHDAPELPPSEGVQVVDGGWKSWEILFLIEGCVTMVVALIGFFWLPHSADTAWFFTAREREWAEQRIRLDQDAAAHGNDHARHAGIARLSSEDEPHVHFATGSLDEEATGSEAHDRLLPDDNEVPRKRKMSTVSTMSVTADSGLTRHDIVSAVLNFKIWHLLICNILSAIPATAFGVFLPLVMKQLSPALKLSPAASNLLSAPPFACGAVVLMLFMRWSDRSQQRLVPILWGLSLLLVGLTLTVLTPTSAYVLRYLSLCVLLSGSFVASPLTVAWLTNNTPEPGKRAILLGINGWGNLAGVFSALLFTPEDEESGYVRPFVVTLVCVLVAFVGFAGFRVMLVRENRWREEGVCRLWTEEEREREEVRGDVPVDEARAGRVGLERWLVKLGGDGVRRGDEKFTYRYGL